MRPSFLGSLLYGELKKRAWENRVLVPIPPRRGKIRRQGWDQVGLLSGILKSRYGMTVVDCMKRTDKVQQKSLDYDKRLKHMEGCLELRKHCLLPAGTSEIIIIDDILTSGATMSAAAGLLQSELNLEVYGAVLCSVI